MRKLFFLFIGIIILCTGCKKENPKAANKEVDRYIEASHNAMQQNLQACLDEMTDETKIKIMGSVEAFDELSNKEKCNALWRYNWFGTCETHINDMSGMFSDTFDTPHS